MRKQKDQKENIFSSCQKIKLILEFRLTLEKMFDTKRLLRLINIHNIFETKYLSTGK